VVSKQHTAVWVDGSRGIHLATQRIDRHGATISFAVELAVGQVRARKAHDHCTLRVDRGYAV